MIQQFKKDAKDLARILLFFNIFYTRTSIK